MATQLRHGWCALLVSFVIVVCISCARIDAQNVNDLRPSSSVAQIARGKPATVTSSCKASEKYCYSPGEESVVCGICSGNESMDSVVNDNSGYWLSSILLKDAKSEQINITIDLMQQFRLHEISLTTAFTPLPAMWLLEASQDHGRNYEVLKYLVSDALQCSLLLDLDDDDEELCIVQTPIKDGLSEKVNVSFDEVVADHIRIRFVSLPQTRNIEEFKEYFRYYSLQDITVKGRPTLTNEISSQRVKRQACYCSRQGTAGFLCNAPIGQVCPCKEKYGGKRCNKCSRGNYDYPTCIPCECSEGGSLSPTCKRATGQCRCKVLIEGRTCNKCEKGYFGFPDCKWCDCNLKHTTGDGCDTSGKCLCKENYDGQFCDRCKLGYDNFPTCTKLACFCTLTGSTSKQCDSQGRCNCKEGYRGAKCNQCSTGYFGYPNCRLCDCHKKGALFTECDSTSGRCVCYPHIAGRRCDRCISGYFGFPRCRSCTCNAYGTQQNALTGSSDCASGRDEFTCTCKENVAGALCDECKDLHYLFSPTNPQGCKTCGCFQAGTIGGLESCDQNTGQCACKPFMEEGKCHECRRGYHTMKMLDTFGCSACKCNPGGARYSNCDKRNGKCQCRRNVGGFLCDRTVTGPVYVPSLHHLKFEVENGHRADRRKLEYNFDANFFPSFSWKGYVPFSPEQSTVQVTVEVPRRSVYRVLFRCIFEPVGYPTTTTATFTISPTQGVVGFTRVVTMMITSTRNDATTERSALLVLSEDGAEEAFLMFAGRWAVTIACESTYLLMDYLVLMPEDYYDGKILQTERVDPCIVDGPNGTVCNMYKYPDIAHESIVKFEAENGFFSKKAWDTEEKLNVKYYRDRRVLRQLEANRMVHLNREQNRFTVEMDIPKSGYYVFVVHYFCPGRTQEKIDMYVHRERGSLHIAPCPYQFGCRQVVMKDINVVKMFDISKGKTFINLFTSEDANIAIDYIKAIPQELWHSLYITPALLCRSLNGDCISSQYEDVPVFKRLSSLSQSTINPFTSSIHGSKVVKLRKFFNPRRDNFQLVLQYQQTEHVIVDCSIVVATYTTVSQGSVRFQYCPNQEYCRILVKPVDGENFNIPQGTTSVELRLPLKKDVKVSWLYVVKASSFTEKMLHYAPYDHSKEFVEKCSDNNYRIPQTDKGYCMKSSFALTMNFNNGALPCRCSLYGARSRYCNKAYGQCLCRRPNIIGRRCSRCASGYYGFPFCRRCACDPRGSDSLNCDYLGRCKCRANFTGSNCNRCKPGFFNFPTCQACSCDVHGSLSTFCTSSGQCQCRRSFDGKACDKCRIGFFGFPECKECNCDASGIKPAEGLPSGCNSSDTVKCLCKDNVQGPQCDTCMDYHYNLQFNNPEGCQKCTCSSLGTNGHLKTCDKVTGQCPCKPHANGQSCALCKDGFTALKDYSMFGCGGCGCDYGGAYDNKCNKDTGTCSCLRNVAGRKCTRVKTRQFYTTDLHHVRAEFEEARLPKGRPVVVRHSEEEFPGFSGRGYMQATIQQSSIDVIISVPRPSKYRLLIRYILDFATSLFVQVTISPTDQVDPLPQGVEGVQVVSTEFPSTATRSRTYANFLTVKKNAKPAEFFLTRGKWRVSLYVYPSPTLLLDYLVMIPQDYYRATNLRQRVQKPCIAGSRRDVFCVEYKYLDIANTNAITVAAKIGQYTGHRKSILPYAPVGSVVLNPQSQLALPPPIQKVGEYVLVVSYYQVEKTVSEIIVGMTSGFTDQTAHVPTTQCKYSFGCRQIAIDDKNKVMLFYLFSNTRNLLYISPQTVLAVMSVSFIPYEDWNMEYLVPEEHCVKHRGACVSTTYEIPQEGIRVDAEKSGQGMKPSLAMDNSVRAAYLAGDGVSLRIKSRIDKGRYKVLVHYYQPSYGRYHGRIIVESLRRSTALSLQFKFCPNVGGCRTLARDKITGFSRSLYIFDDVDMTISIPAPNELWIDYILFVPIRQFQSSMEHPEPVSLAKTFLRDCTLENYIINRDSSAFCRQAVFTMTTQFNEGATACRCHQQGALSTSCDTLGGQCPCKANVVGRTCDQCKGGYTGFPNCRRT